MNATWSHHQILTALRLGATPLVLLFPDGAARDLSHHQASKLNGNYQVQISPHEIIVVWHQPSQPTENTPRRC